MKVVPVVAVIDEEDGFEALYVEGTLRLQEYTLHMCDIAEVTKGLVIEFSQLVVSLPDGADWPENLKDVQRYTLVDEAAE